jgi:hypothetical protein
MTRLGHYDHGPPESLSNWREMKRTPHLGIASHKGREVSSGSIENDSKGKELS